jgi:hypothetical protein
MALIYKVLFSSISTFETPPFGEAWKHHNREAWKGGTSFQAGQPVP